ncbi:hypothetical protein CRG98_014466 [Punica granatum]|uniref:Uncharacterized protein n=1 Tax=Punica granatum TaxID=22663 RepID=A0A2I0K9D0_PUNGR|nr:hypothetical protein CRG98_014466 [Punica granatum]
MEMINSSEQSRILLRTEAEHKFTEKDRRRAWPGSELERRNLSRPMTTGKSGPASAGHDRSGFRSQVLGCGKPWNSLINPATGDSVRSHSSSLSELERILMSSRPLLKVQLLKIPMMRQLTRVRPVLV